MDGEDDGSWWLTSVFVRVYVVLPTIASGRVPKKDLSFPTDGYAPVADRVRLFYERYPTGRIVTHLVRRTDEEVMFRAEVFRGQGEREPAATGWAAEREGDGDINTVACLENTETSAVGRALANLGLIASPHRPSREEMQKADRARARVRAVATPPASGTTDPDIQWRADQATETIALLKRALRLGFSARRAGVMRNCVTQAEVDEATLVRIDRRLRDWLERRLDRVEWP